MSKENELLQAVLDARQTVAEQENFLSDAKEKKEKMELALIEFMDDHGLKSFKSITLNCSCVRKEVLYVSIDKEKKEEAFRWIEEDCGRKDLLKLTVHNKTLSSFVGGMLKEGKEIPQELFKYFFKPGITIMLAK